MASEIQYWHCVITDNILLVSLIIPGHGVGYNGARSVGVSWSRLSCWTARPLLLRQTAGVHH